MTNTVRSDSESLSHTVPDSTKPLKVWEPFAGIMILVLGIFGTSLFIEHRSAAKLDYLDIGYKLCTLALIASGLLTFLLNRRQAEVARQSALKEFAYKRIDAFYTHFSGSQDREKYNAYVDVFRQQGLLSKFDGLGTELNAEEVNRLLAEPGNDQAIRLQLDVLESFAAAVHIGFVDPEYAYKLQGTRIIRTGVVLRHVLERYRNANRDAYVQLVNLAAEWRDKKFPDLAVKGVGVITNRF